MKTKVFILGCLVVTSLGFLLGGIQQEENEDDLFAANVEALASCEEVPADVNAWYVDEKNPDSEHSPITCTLGGAEKYK